MKTSTTTRSYIALIPTAQGFFSDILIPIDQPFVLELPHSQTMVTFTQGQAIEHAKTVKEARGDFFKRIELRTITTENTTIEDDMPTELVARKTYKIHTAWDEITPMKKATSVHDEY